ncbi:hypothetical protein [Pseudomonas laurylsulfatiphila]|uniref:hypothetical protein n=1 Tax=Pseudomonas laurylsulfatiphila TaxID=2011015 RepID=UPI002160F0AC|nr:hypothetical protein [Pseudomonas laurylsulfatiphila]UVM06044.1 hypothetical protein LOY25_04895 [Pseudomonas laurylsulfatiphila]
MRYLYGFRVVLVSVEALVLALGYLAWTYVIPQLDEFASSLELNDEMLKYLMLLPAALAVWVFNEVRGLLQEDKDTIQILVNWPDYWKLKTHAWVSLMYAVVFACMSLLPWVVKSGIGTGSGMLLFVISIVGQLALAISVYLARISLQEIVVYAKAS